MIEHKTLEFRTRTRGRSTTDIGAEIQHAVAASGVRKGLYLYEHRHAGHARSVVVTVMGDAWRRRGKVPRPCAVFSLS